MTGVIARGAAVRTLILMYIDIKRCNRKDAIQHAPLQKAPHSDEEQGKGIAHPKKAILNRTRTVRE
jgi:hypothetical protein